MAIVKASVVQAAPVPFEREKTLEKVRALSAEAAKRDSQLVIFPEAFVSAYPKGLDFGARVGMRKPEGREDFRRYFDSAVDVPGPAVDYLGRVAKENAIHLVIGVIERDGGTLYCTILTFQPNGDYLGKHRKLMPTALERLVWGFGDGSTLPVFHTEIGILGSVICWENYMPALRMAMYNKGIQLYCAPTADDRPTWPSTMQHVAMEGRCFVLSCNQYTTRGDFPENYDAIQGTDPATVISRGGSCIVSPLGQFLAGPDFDGENILTAELDMDDIVRGKYDFDVTGHYARPDIFKLLVNEASTKAVEIVNQPFEE
ncbi:MAG TPA: nitrilase [Gammaproteobacteria bacterium]|jgi:nitrilase|nr:nitrilase-related carbon-nitrogen hydrolase [Arenicellales bacterium]MDP7489265.1 nitrilase-related carbon-nitrogen hydrolase [Arenicellales bacterium]MDP7524203.1 nitrilase-related carbon-nitrogen hydrolase [Arenicellales bacterium]HCV20597.1 nitrilase [Gammaproteobacteria bacterium]|tara:strand:- start:119 stop:1063 length:945 start_codon:yes stop_codon:yes gene_type:complete